MAKNQAKATAISPGSAAIWTSVTFVGVLVAGTYFIGETINGLVSVALSGSTLSNLEALAASSIGLVLSVIAVLFLIYRLDLGSGSIRRRVKAFEVGWKG